MQSSHDLVHSFLISFDNSELLQDGEPSDGLWNNYFESKRQLINRVLRFGDINSGRSPSFRLLRLSDIRCQSGLDEERRLLPEAAHEARARLSVTFLI